MMDRGVAKLARLEGLGGDYLFDGGTAEITRIRCCSYYGFDYPVIQRTGNRGAVRDFFKSADISIANLESAVLVDAPYHRAGFTFTADASLLDAVERAGFDYLSLANNHVRNAGARGIRVAMEQLDQRGIAHAGSGLDRQAGTPAFLETPTGIRVAIFSCDAIVPSWTATDEKFGTLNCKKSDVAGRIRAVRDQADVIIVFPHWGREYKPQPAPYQKKLAQDWIDAGATVVTGGHSHIAGAMGDYDGHVVFFSMGNLIFDQDFRQSTMMGVIPEMTFEGDRLVQIKLHPTLITDAQPNFANKRDGQFVIDQMRNGSEGLLPY
jgi:poly-gamma-glutamate capsule biosynthesis protein CapA/YwtB (metallophosphatase superfamily)